jgi:hypothetical protein
VSALTTEQMTYFSTTALRAFTDVQVRWFSSAQLAALAGDNGVKLNALISNS